MVLNKNQNNISEKTKDEGETGMRSTVAKH